jgi:membrane-associated phospholipid phosphatase
VTRVEADVDAAQRHTGRSFENRSRGLTCLKPADEIALVYLIVVALLIFVFRGSIEQWGWFTVGHLVIATAIIWLAQAGNKQKTRQSAIGSVIKYLRGWYAIPLISINYKELTYLIPRIHPRDFDSALAAIDHRMFGANPTVWLERITFPVLTEVLQFTYSTYYFLPLILGIILWRAKRADDFFFWVFIVFFGFYLSYAGYMAVPAIGPRFLPAIVEAQTKPLEGVWLFGAIRHLLDSAEGLTRDCFPSGHTELTLLVLYYSRKLHRRAFWWFVPFGVGIIVSTVYLRYHYVIDVIAGAFLAVMVILMAKPLFRLLGGTTKQNLSSEIIL